MDNEYWPHKTAEIQRGAEIGAGTKIWHNSQVIGGAQIGKNCIIGHNCLIAGKAKLGNGVKIESNTDVWDFVELKDYVFVGPSAVFTNDSNPRAKYPKKDYPHYGKWKSTVIEEGASIGANATIVCGNKIGKWAFIGAGSVVTKDIPNYALVVGVPGKVIGWVCECGNKLCFKSRISANKKTNERECAKCHVCKNEYVKQDMIVTKTLN